MFILLLVSVVVSVFMVLVSVVVFFVFVIRSCDCVVGVLWVGWIWIGVGVGGGVGSGVCLRIICVLVLLMLNELMVVWWVLKDVGYGVVWVGMQNGDDGKLIVGLGVLKWVVGGSMFCFIVLVVLINLVMSVVMLR